MKRKILSEAYFQFLLKYTQIILEDHWLSFVKDAPSKKKSERRLSHRFSFLEMADEHRLLLLFSNRRFARACIHEKPI